jgi:hypothetical protein
MRGMPAGYCLMRAAAWAQRLGVRVAGYCPFHQGRVGEADPTAFMRAGIEKGGIPAGRQRPAYSRGGYFPASSRISSEVTTLRCAAA